MPEPEHEITRLLVAMQDGEDAARDALIPLVYDELRVLARGRLRREHGARTVSATDLVHEAYLRVLGRTGPGFDNRAHFFSAAAEAMRRVLIDRARGRGTNRAGAGRLRVTLNEAVLLPDDEREADDEDLLALDEALADLERVDERMARVVVLRTFGGLTVEDAARVLGISPRSVKREWACARAWLLDRLRPGGPRHGGT